MDLTKIVKDRVATMPDGLHKAGLSAVVRHIEVAEGHFTRGTLGDHSAYTDAVYRSNQAFEGSLKEAYRVLTDKDPAKKTPYDIETYLTTNSVLRERVVSELKNFRKEWRNPATHDYKLDFDSSEALLAITYVCGFTFVILDQVIEAKAKMLAKEAASVEFDELLMKITEDETKFIESMLGILGSQILTAKLMSNKEFETDSEAIGTIAGYIEGVMPYANVNMHQNLGGETTFAPDIYVSTDAGGAAVEYLHEMKDKSYLTSLSWNLDQAVAVEGIGIVFIVASANELNREISEFEGAGSTKFYIIGDKSMGKIGAEDVWANASWS